ncbi:hypothetical protein AAZV13_09G081300 [Glycine max]|uniref:Putative E3 ubiquitin-protein ligase RHY1A isoform C n=1 Tax=Glycine soja TaxID=3848 RepID=A0A445IZ13_GLYSO|nr:probable E3 ubiquitin-protein ligase RHY1A isoform X3 [Glycine max]XP_028179717.1 probable E3 ubiquitin-protein ligase RHY1A isoform X2 [Glycine soja]RZB91360.1 putative E3 ubiquitin-protein ligase RHY1A isoform C [Glycine soja]|eukprot:XP_006587140.1 probable E3 ubiquitin-protein ligase RHY1A isoform X3 [Glycine max]
MFGFKFNFFGITCIHKAFFFLFQRSMLYQAHPDENMGGVAREAKQRLDDKFRAQRMSENKRQNNTKCVEGKRTSIIVLHTEEYGSKKSGSRRFSWTKWSWKASEQEECAVCLESFRVGETLIHLPCAHRFHDRCLKPWLENNSYCPCCRTTILPL